MRLKYNILWFDDDTDWIESVEDEITDFLLDNGFILNFENHRNAIKLDNVITDMKNNVKDIDIILMDYKLLNHDKGDAIIKKIREQEVLTEILFYSQDAAVRNKFKEECIEGIYFSNRSDFLVRLFQIIPHTIKKVLDLTNMRGLVIAEASSLDLSLNELLLNMITLLDNHSPCQRQVVIDKVFTKRLSQAHKIKDIDHKYEYVDGTPNIKFNVKATEILAHHMDISTFLENMESSERVESINKLYKIVKEKVDVNQEKLTFFKKYKNDIIDVRNVLAHVTEDIVDGKTVLKSKIKGYEQFTFTHGEFAKIRKSLISHTDNIRDLNSGICENL